MSESRELTTEQRILLNSEIDRRGKNMVVAYLLLLFMGTLGIHRFYLGQTGTGIAQLSLTIVGWFTVWIIIGIIPLAIVGVWVIIDLFLVPGIVEKENRKLEIEIRRTL